MIDASIIVAPKQHFTKEEEEIIDAGAVPADWTPAKRCQKDLDATWTKKHGNSYHGYKISINVDKRYKIIRNVVTDTASTHDSHHFDAVLDAGNNTSRDVYADKGYTSKAREEQLKKAGLRNHIQRKGARNPFPVRLPETA